MRLIYCIQHRFSFVHSFSARQTISIWFNVNFSTRQNLNKKMSRWTSIASSAGLVIGSIAIRRIAPPTGATTMRRIIATRTTLLPPFLLCQLLDSLTQFCVPFIVLPLNEPINIACSMLQPQLIKLVNREILWKLVWSILVQILKMIP